MEQAITGHRAGLNLEAPAPQITMMQQRQGSSLPECRHRPGVGSASEEPGKLLAVAAPVAARSLKVSALAAGAVAVACGRGWWLSGIR